MNRHLSVGIDEAGRGCVIGPLVVAIVAADHSDRRWFNERNVRDSKIVPPKQRDDLAKRIKDRCWFQLRVAHPPMIDDAVRDRSRTLNGLELEMMADLLREFSDEHGDAEATALVDAPSINAQGFLEKLYSASGWEAMERLHAKHEADRTDRTVAAASILAKHERERLITKLKKELGVDFGCGYSHDEVTRSFVRTCPRDATCVRWSWATAKRPDQTRGRADAQTRGA
jgi:ribonuclease HII